ncbi:flagellin [Viridibacillus arvi]|uniref:flagellin n=1 Tax=Viridibacillus arvi TaxID=263475 RepID=UPI003CFD41CF
MKISIADTRSQELGISSISLLDTTLSQNAISLFDNAIKMISDERSKIGSIQNRLEHSCNSVMNTFENLTSSESRIRDVDMAKEMMKFTKHNILNQAVESMLVQSNQQPEGILQLLK